MFAPVYLDHNATTALHPAVLEAMLPYFDVRYGNASSRHEYGRAARKAIDEARQKIAAALMAQPSELVFTSGGSEANNLFIKGAAAGMKPGLIGISAIEHPCVREAAKALTRSGWQVHEVAVDGDGRVDPADYAALLARKPSIISVMCANNETGVLNDVAALATQARPSGAPWFHADAVQALGKSPVSFRQLNASGIHGVSVSAHKIGGPKGAAALVVDKRVELKALISGGGQERGLRSGTENVAAIVGFGVACELAVAAMERNRAHLLGLQAQLEQGLAAQGALIFASTAARLPNTSYFAFAGIDGETLVGRLDRAGFAVASGAACSSANPEPSHVLRAMGIADGLARGAVRVSLGATNTQEQIGDFLSALAGTVAQLKRMTALAG